MKNPTNQEVQVVRSAWIERVRSAKIKSTKYYIRTTKTTIKNYINWDYKNKELAEKISEALPTQNCFAYFGGKNNAGYKTVREANIERSRIAKVVDSVQYLDMDVERGSNFIDDVNYDAS